jgi:ATP-dependent helicase/nuclease subunit B
MSRIGFILAAEVVMLPRIIESVVRVCKQYPVDRKVLLVRNHHAGQLMLQSLARCAGGWLNLRAMTPADLAAENLTAADDLTLETIVIEAYHDTKRAFFPDKPPLGLIAAVYRTLVELRIAAVKPAHLRAMKSPKGSDLAAILERYESALKRDRLLDEAETYRLSAGTKTPGTTLLLPPTLRTVGLCREFVNSCRAGRTITLEEDAAGSMPAGRIDIFAAVGARNEIREILRRIVEGRIPFEDVEVILPNYSSYAPLFADVAAEIGGIAITFGAGLPGLRSGPARTLYSFAEWISNDCPEPVLRAMFAGGGIRPPKDVSGRQAARQLRSARIGWGRDRYVERLEAVQASAMAAHLRDLLELLDRKNVFESAAAFLEQYAVVRSESEAGVLNRLVTRLRSSRPDSETKLRLQAIAQSVSVDASAARPGHIHVAPLAAAGLTCRRHVFVPGLSEAAYPGTLANDPILTDEERRSVSAELTVSAEVMKERELRFREAFARVHGNLILSYSITELGDGSRVFPSPLLLDAHRLVSGKPGADYEDLARTLGAPAGFIPGLPLCTDEWWLSKIGDKGLLRDAQESVLAANPDLKAGRAALASRKEAASGEHDGKLARDAGFDPRTTRRPVSVTALEGYASCPRQFLFRNLLGIELPDELDVEPGRWLDPLQRGLLLHEFYRRFLAQLRGKKQKRDPEKHRQPAGLALDEVIAEWRNKLPPPSEVVFESERALLHRSLGVFLREESSVPAEGRGTPEYFELSFGLPDDGTGDGGTPDPVEVTLPDGRTILLRGRIDRLDRLAQPGTWAVWDYKTGHSKKYGGNQYTAGGTQLQHVLYACAAEQILRKLGAKNPKVVISGYLFPTERSDGNVCVPRNARRRAEGLAVLSDLLDAMASGIFLGTGANCKYCDWGDACHADEKERWDALSGAQDDSAAELGVINEQE